MPEAEPREAAGTAQTAEIFRFVPTLRTRVFQSAGLLLFQDLEVNCITGLELNTSGFIN